MRETVIRYEYGCYKAKYKKHHMCTVGPGKKQNKHMHVGKMVGSFVQNINY